MTDRNYIIPPVDIYEKDNMYLILMDMPGADKDSIEIIAEGDLLKVSAKTLEVDKEWKPISTEFSFANYYKREFSIGKRVNRDNIQAKYENGILKIELEKSEIAKPRKIEVKAG